MKKKILITTESLMVGGVETTLLSFLKLLCRYDVEVDLYVLDKGALSKEFESLTKVHLIDSCIPKNRLLYRIFKTLKCKSLYRYYQNKHKKEYDIAIAFYGINNYCDMFAAASNAKKKYIWVHTNYDEIAKMSKHKFLLKMRNKMMAKKYPYFDKIISVSNSSRRGFLKLFPIEEERVLVINNILDEGRLEGRSAPCAHTFVGNHNLVSIGRLAPTKRVDLLLDEFAKVREVFCDAHLYIVGDGEEMTSLKKKVSDEHMEENVIFVGNQNNPFPYLEQADVFVTASESESYSLNLLEAMAMHTYFVSTDNEGAKDMYYHINREDKNNGIVCPTNKIHEHVIYYLNHRDEFHPNFQVEQLNDQIEQLIVKEFHIVKK